MGPISLCNRAAADAADAAERGRGLVAAAEAARILTWLDSKLAGSVIYVCFGSLLRFPVMQMREIKMGLEDSRVPFLWVIREVAAKEEIEWRVGERGMVVRGWVPQVEALGHAAVGGFMTHCGWGGSGGGSGGGGVGTDMAIICGAGLQLGTGGWGGGDGGDGWGGRFRLGGGGEGRGGGREHVSEIRNGDSKAAAAGPWWFSEKSQSLDLEPRDWNALLGMGFFESSRRFKAPNLLRCFQEASAKIISTPVLPTLCEASK